MALLFLLGRIIFKIRIRMRIMIMIVIFLLLSSECWVGYTDYCTITSESTIRH